MAYERMLDREINPDRELVLRTIGKEVAPIWEEATSYIDEQFCDYEPEWNYSNPQQGWGLRYRRADSHLCTLFPERRSFTVLLTLNAAEEQKALEKINYFNARIRELLNQSSTLPEGRWLWIRLEDYTDFVGLKLLLELKDV